MSRLLLGTIALLLIAPSHAWATDIDLGLSSRFAPSLSAVPQIGVRDLRLGGGDAGIHVSSAGVGLSYSRSLALPPLGVVSTTSSADVAWGGGYLLSSRASASVGPVALNVGAERFTVARTTFEPLAGWLSEATDLRPLGWNADLNAKYRVNRTLIATLGAELGGQPFVAAQVEQRRELFATPPSEEETAQDLPPESTGTLSLRGGGQAGRGVLGLTAGATYAAANGLSLSLDALLGAQPGLVVGASFPEWNAWTTNIYAAYEPWRLTSATLRYGVEGSRPVGENGSLNIAFRGGRLLNGQHGFGVEAHYVWTLPTRGE